MTFEEMQKLSPEEQKELFKKLKVARQSGKQVNFSAVYGVGKDTLARASGLSLKEAEKLLTTYWERNGAVKQVAEKCIVREIGNKKWLYNPISGFWISLRAEKDRFSSLAQNTATYVFDLWIKNMRTLGLKIPYYYHDEILTEVYKIDLKETEEIINKAMTMVNEELKLNVTVGCSINSGKNYAETH